MRNSSKFSSAKHSGYIVSLFQTTNTDNVTDILNSEGFGSNYHSVFIIVTLTCLSTYRKHACDLK